MDILVINRKDIKFYYTIYEYCRNIERIILHNSTEDYSTFTLED